MDKDKSNNQPYSDKEKRSDQSYSDYVGDQLNDVVSGFADTKGGRALDNIVAMKTAMYPCEIECLAWIADELHNLNEKLETLKKNNDPIIDPKTATEEQKGSFDDLIKKNEFCGTCKNYIKHCGNYADWHECIYGHGFHLLWEPCEDYAKGEMQIKEEK